MENSVHKIDNSADSSRISWNILLIESETDSVELIRVILRSGEFINFKIDQVNSIETAFHYLIDNTPDMILLNLELNDSHGIETFNLIYNYVPVIPIIVTTGNTDPELEQKLRAKGAFGFVQKSKLNYDVLTNAVFRYIELKNKSTVEFEKRLDKTIESHKITPKILVVDDRYENIVAMKCLLNDIDAEVLTATSGNEALASSLEHEFAVMLMDVQMPGMDGFETVNLLRSNEDTRNVPVLFITAINKEKPDITRGYNVGAVDYIFKPVDPDILLSKVKIFLTLYNNEKQKKLLIDELRKSQTEMEEQRERFKFMAMHDSLTMLPNRYLFERKTNSMIDYCRRYKHDFAVLLFDVDNFKWINDSHGHDIGDNVLKFFAKILKKCLRKGDVVARIGGDEFAVLLPEVKKDSASIVAQKFLQILSETPIEVKGEKLKLTSSIGITNSFDAGVNDYSSIFKRADIALYRAKEGGKNRYDFFSDDLHDIYMQNKKMIDALKQALENNEFYLLYQPILDIKENQIVGVETLIRWDNPELGITPPNDFIPLLEDNRIIHLVGLWIIETVCKDISNFKNSAADSIFFTVNLSVVQLERLGFTDDVCEIMKKYNVNKNSIFFEVKENIVPKLLKVYKKNLEDFVENGLNLAIDNFGIRPNSAAYFGETNFNALKIGLNLLKDVDNNPKKANIVKSLIEFADKISIRVIAEQVETEEQVTFLKENGCRWAQGYYFYKPMTGEELRKVISKHRK